MSDFTRCCVGIRNPNTCKTLGTGFIITNDGYIVTCFHILKKLLTEEKLDFVNIHFPFDDSDETKAYILKDYCNSVLDIATLKIEGKLSPNTNVANLGTTVSEDNSSNIFSFKKR